ncbi:hypothetical protein [Paenibacillus plantiphilus]|uniref:hypothetical protein n=1 Tax=Paenibacillus plantiphilus TaxID=2905650 RepID=UPI001F1B3A68|nr:hypothetical protein [Paenibacillus plantiphilus]
MLNARRFCFRTSTNRRDITFRAEQVGDHLPEQFASLSLAVPVSPGLAASASERWGFGGVDAAERKLTHRANHHDREPFGARVLPESNNRQHQTQEQQEQA